MLIILVMVVSGVVKPGAELATLMKVLIMVIRLVKHYLPNSMEVMTKKRIVMVMETGERGGRGRGYGGRSGGDESGW